MRPHTVLGLLFNNTTFPNARAQAAAAVAATTTASLARIGTCTVLLLSNLQMMIRLAMSEI